MKLSLVQFITYVFCVCVSSAMREQVACMKQGSGEAGLGLRAGGLLKSKLGTLGSMEWKLISYPSGVSRLLKIGFRFGILEKR